MRKFQLFLTKCEWGLKISTDFSMFIRLAQLQQMNQKSKSSSTRAVSFHKWILSTAHCLVPGGCIVSKSWKSLASIYEITLECGPLYIGGMYSFLSIMLPILHHFRHILLTSHLCVRSNALGDCDCYCLSKQPFSRWKIKTTLFGIHQLKSHTYIPAIRACVIPRLTA